MKRKCFLVLIIMMIFCLCSCEFSGSKSKKTEFDLETINLDDETDIMQHKVSLGIRLESSIVNYVKHSYTGYHTYHIDKDNNLYGGIDETYNPTLIAREVKSISADRELVSILKTNGELYYLKKSETNLIKVMDNVISHSSDGYAITADGRVWDVIANEQIPGIQNAKIVNDGLVITSDGKLYSIVVDKEYNDRLQLEKTVKTVFIANNVSSACENGKEHGIEEHTILFLKNDNTLWAYGANKNESVYFPETEQERYEYISNIKYSSGVPIIVKPIKIMNDIVSVSTSGSTHLVLKKNGELWGWGNNFDNELGSSYSQEIKPIYIMSDVVDIYAGQGASLAINSSGELWFCGALTEEKSGTPKFLVDNVSYYN